MSRAVLSADDIATLFEGARTGTGSLEQAVQAVFLAGGGRISDVPRPKRSPKAMLRRKLRHAETARFLRARFEWLLDAIAERHGIPVERLIAPDVEGARRAEWTARMELCWLLRVGVDTRGVIAFQTIAAMINRDHSSVMHAVRKIDALIAERPTYRDELLSLVDGHAVQGERRKAVAGG